MVKGLQYTLQADSLISLADPTQRATAAQIIDFRLLRRSSHPTELVAAPSLILDPLSFRPT